jgi:hypothetical protein
VSNGANAGDSQSCKSRGKGRLLTMIVDNLKAVFLPEASDFIARNGAETVKITKQAGSIQQNEFIKGLQEQAVESNVSITAGVHLPTDSESHVFP